MKRIEFKIGDNIIQGIEIIAYDKKDWKHKIIYAQNRLIEVSFIKVEIEEDDERNNYFMYDQVVTILENYCVMEDCTNFSISHPEIDESYVGEW